MRSCVSCVEGFSSGVRGAVCVRGVRGSIPIGGSWLLFVCCGLLCVLLPQQALVASPEKLALQLCSAREGNVVCLYFFILACVDVMGPLVILLQFKLFSKQSWKSLERDWNFKMKQLRHIHRYLKDCCCNYLTSINIVVSTHHIV